MGMGNCIYCEETPCSCGHEWQRMSFHRLKEIYEVVKKTYEKRAEKELSKDKTPWANWLAELL